MSPVYKALEVTPDTVRGCSPWGILEVDVKIGTKETFWVDALQFVGVLKTLPAGDVTFTQSGSTLSWSCQRAQGKLALLGKLDIPTQEWEKLEEKNIDADFLAALQLGSLSASRDIGMSSAGVTGVAITYMQEPLDDRNIFIASSDNVTMSIASTLVVGEAHWPDTIVIGAEAASMLGTVLGTSARSSGAILDIQEKAIFAYADGGRYRLMVRAALPMQHNILELSLNYPKEEIVTALPSDVVKRFVARAATLAEAKAHTHVKIAAASGGLRLSFAEGTVMSDEDYQIADLVLKENFPEVKLDASRLARALGYADMLALDAFDKGVLTLFTSKERKGPEFSYLINGAQEKGA